MGMPKLGVGFKILLAMLLLSFAGVGAACFIGLLSMNSMAKSALAASRILGGTAITDSKIALIAQSREELLSISRDQAYITNMKLERVATQVNATARIYGISDDKGAEASRGFLLLSEKNSEPEDITAFSAFSLAPGVDLDSVKHDIGRLSKLQQSAHQTALHRHHLRSHLQASLDNDSNWI